MDKDRKDGHSGETVIIDNGINLSILWIALAAVALAVVGYFIVQVTSHDESKTTATLSSESKTEQPAADAAKPSPEEAAKTEGAAGDAGSEGKEGSAGDSDDAPSAVAAENAVAAGSPESAGDSDDAADSGIADGGKTGAEPVAEGAPPADATGEATGTAATSEASQTGASGPSGDGSTAAGTAVPADPAGGAEAAVAADGTGAVQEGTAEGSPFADVEQRDGILTLKGDDRAAILDSAEGHWQLPAPGQKAGDGWQTIVVQNRRKVDYTILPRKGAPWKLGEEDRKIKVLFPEDLSDSKDILSRKKRGKYAVQMLSLEADRYNRGLEIVRLLVRDGYYAYIYRTHKEYEGRYWYRVRIGFYRTVDDAQAAGQEIYQRYKDLKIFPDTYWPVAPSPRELGREIVDLRMASSKPWVIQLGSGNRQQAFSLLPRLSNGEDFFSVSVRGEGGAREYRTQLGFFETKAEANERLRVLKKSSAVDGAEVVEVK